MRNVSLILMPIVLLVTSILFLALVNHGAKKGDKQVILIPQIHVGQQVANDEEINVTIQSQEFIYKTVKSLKQTHGRIAICSEGVYDVDKHVTDDWEASRRDLDDLVAEAKKLSQRGKGDQVEDLLADWYKWIAKQFSPGYAQGMNITGAFELQSVASSTSELQKINPFGRSIVYYLGGVRQAFLDGTITRSELVPCDDKKSFLAGVKLLSETVESEDKIANELLRLSEEREYTIVKNAIDFLNNQEEIDTIVIILGATHDLTDEVNKYSNNKSRVTFITIAPPNLDELIGKITH